MCAAKTWQNTSAGEQASLLLFASLISLAQGVPNHWSVSYSSQNICALKGSSVELHSYYTYPYGHIVNQSLWFVTWTLGQEPDNLMEDEHYLGRVNYKDDENNHTLSIRNLTTTDSTYYRFRFITDKDRAAGGSVKLSVTGNLHLTINNQLINVFVICEGFLKLNVYC